MALSNQRILDYIAAHPGAGREEIRRHTAPNASSPTVWRALKRLVEENKLEVSGKGRATGYSLADAAVVRAHLAKPYNRRKPASYNKDFIDHYVPGRSFYLSTTDRQRLRDAGTPTMPPLSAGTYAQRVLERLLVDLSWASSRMEGNTYSILETERLIRFGEEASGKDRKEAIMILNHKEAIQYVVDNLDAITISRPDLTNIHALLAGGLSCRPRHGRPPAPHARRHYPLKLQTARRSVRNRGRVCHPHRKSGRHNRPVRAVHLLAHSHPLFAGLR